MKSVPTIILPGLNGSGPEHWQTIWQQNNPGFIRMQPSSWENPRLDDWLKALKTVVAGSDTPPILVAHSLSCLLIAHFLADGGGPVAGVFLAAASDPDRENFPERISHFAPFPLAPLPCPALMLASSNDSYATLDFAEATAAAWGATLIDVGPCGHINPDGGVGAWAQGWNLFAAFRCGLGHV